MAVVDIEDQKTGTLGLALCLRRVGRAEVQIALRLGLILRVQSRCERRKTEDCEEKEFAHQIASW